MNIHRESECGYSAYVLRIWDIRTFKKLNTLLLHCTLLLFLCCLKTKNKTVFRSFYTWFYGNSSRNETCALLNIVFGKDILSNDLGLPCMCSRQVSVLRLSYILYYSIRLKRRAINTHHLPVDMQFGLRRNASRQRLSRLQDFFFGFSPLSGYKSSQTAIKKNFTLNLVLTVTTTGSYYIYNQDNYSNFT